MKFRASKLEIRKVDAKIEKEFLLENHYQGYTPSIICYGLYNKDELLILMSFCIPRFNKKYDWELLRLCTKKDAIVYGGASKLLKHFMNNFKDCSIISYCNRDKFSGNVYHQLGFTSIGITKGYHYEKDDIIYPRYKLQKQKLLKMFPQYDNSWTEAKICSEQGYIRVDDKIGQETFVIKPKCKWYIYEIECNGYHYIGQHKYYNDNFNDGYTTSGTIIKRLIKKYPFKKTILVDNIMSIKQANELEIKHISLSKEKYAEYNVNILKGGQSAYTPRERAPLTEETRQKISKAMKGKLVGEKNPFYGKCHSDKTRKKLSEASTGENSHCYGKHWYTDGKVEVYDFNCPDGFREGRLESCNKNKKWFTNGTDNYFGFECPDGYYTGLTLSEERKEAIRKNNLANIKYEWTDELINDALTLNYVNFSKKYNYSRTTYKRIRRANKKCSE